MTALFGTEQRRAAAACAVALLRAVRDGPARAADRVTSLCTLDSLSGVDAAPWATPVPGLDAPRPWSISVVGQGTIKIQRPAVSYDLRWPACQQYIAQTIGRDNQFGGTGGISGDGRGVLYR